MRGRLRKRPTTPRGYLHRYQSCTTTANVQRSRTDRPLLRDTNMLPAIIGAGAVIGAALLANKGQADANEESAQQAQLNRDFNSAEAAKSREWQQNMRQTQYQTAVSDLKAAGLNPMLAYQQGGSGTPTGATASNQSMPQIGNKMAAALNASAQAAQIMNIKAQTEKTEADTAVPMATAKQVEAQTALTTSSTTNVQQQTTNPQPNPNTTHCHDKQQQSLTCIAYETNVVSDINT